MMTPAKLALLLLIGSCLSALGGWEPVDAGVLNQLNSVDLLENGAAMAVGENGIILRSAKSNADWIVLNSGTKKTLHAIHLFNSEQAIAVGDGGTIIRTSDHGDHWTPVASGVHDALLSVSFHGRYGICGGDSQDIIYSNDAGATWHVSQKNFFGGNFSGAQMIGTKIGFVAGQNSIFQPLLGMTADGGATWTFHNFYFNGNEGGSDDVFFFDETTGVVSGTVFDGTGALARTTDGGATFDSTLFPNALHGIDFPTPEIGFVVGAGGTILKSTDGGATWNPQDSGTSEELRDVRFIRSGRRGLAVGSNGTILRTRDGGGSED